MEFVSRIIVFLLVAGLSIGTALVGCNDDTKSDDNVLTMAMASLNYAPDRIYLYNGGLHDGKLNSRSDADSMCRTAASGITALSEKRFKKSFISFSSTDQMKDLVETGYAALPVYGIKADGTGTLMKDIWSNLFTATGINDTLGNGTGITSHWWSGSRTDGTYAGDANSCNSWTCNSNTCVPGSTGTAGRYDNSSSGAWLSSVGLACNATTVFILCVAY